MQIHKRYFLILGLFLINTNILNAQSVGVNTTSPAKSLHIKSGNSDDPLRLEGVKTGAGSFLVADDNGVIKTTKTLGPFVFILPSISSTSGLSLTSETGNNSYAENSAPDSKIWSKIPDMESTFDIIRPSNSLNISAEGMVQYNATMSAGISVNYAIGIFLDGKLIASRVLYLRGDNFTGTFAKWDVLGQATNLAIGSHKIELYATRRSNVSASSAIYIAQPATINQSLNQFMAKAVLQIIGIYN